MYLSVWRQIRSSALETARREPVTDLTLIAHTESLGKRKSPPPPTFEGISGGKWIHCFISHTDVREIAVTKASSSSSSGGHLSCHSSVYFTLKCPRDVFQQPVQSLQTLALSMIPTRFSVQEHQLYLLWITSVFHNDGKKTILFYSNDLWCFIRISIHKHKKRIF